MRKEDWLLLMLKCAGPHGLSPVQLQKALFMIGREAPQATGQDYYAFQPHNYGPFDANAYRDAEALARQGLVVITPEPGQSWATYSVSPEGGRRAETASKELSAEVLKYAQDVASWIREMSFAQLVRAIYARYPEYRANSVFRG